MAIKNKTSSNRSSITERWESIKKQAQELKDNYIKVKAEKLGVEGVKIKSIVPSEKTLECDIGENKLSECLKIDITFEGGKNSYLAMSNMRKDLSKFIKSSFAGDNAPTIFLSHGSLKKGCASFLVPVDTTGDQKESIGLIHSALDDFTKPGSGAVIYLKKKAHLRSSLESDCKEIEESNAMSFDESKRKESEDYFPEFVGPEVSLNDIRKDSVERIQYVEKGSKLASNYPAF